MESRWRRPVVLVSALAIAGLLMFEDATLQREVDESNRTHPHEKMSYAGSWTKVAACWLALLIAVMEGRELLRGLKRAGGVRN
jgi:hypothetical protein